MAFSAETVESAPTNSYTRRRRPRHPLRSLAYVKLQDGNGGIIRDLTESGVAVQAVMPLSVGQEIPLRFDLVSPRIRFEGQGRVCWADRNGQAGIEFSHLAHRTTHNLRDWIFAQMLSSACISGRDSIFSSLEPLMISDAARPAIVLDVPRIPSGVGSVRWAGIPFSARSFSLLVDILVLACAVLLFSITALAIMGGLPAPPLAAALFFASGMIFTAAYMLIFSDFLCGATPGQRLAMLASSTERPVLEQRFR